MRSYARGRRLATLAVALIVVLGLTGALAATGALVRSRQALGSSTTLSIIAGAVDVRHGSQPFGGGVDGEVLEAGDGVRTGADGRAVLTYFDGSTVEIEPSSELAIDSAGIEPDSSTVIVMTQVIGHTWHVVTRQLGPNSRYEVNTPAATALVRGTTFEVLVERDVDGEPVATVLTTEGTVGFRRAATAATPAEEVSVEAGREAAAKRGRPIEPPKPRREPQRVVTMTIGSERTVVVDPLGRANGMRDGKVVIQTPGARVERVDGRLVVTLPDVPEGSLAAHVERDRHDEVAVETRVRERGRGEERAEARAALPARGAAVVDVEVRRGARPELRARLNGIRPSPSATGTSPSPTGIRPRAAVPTLPTIPTLTPTQTIDPRLLLAGTPTPSPRPTPSASPGPPSAASPAATATPGALTVPTLRPPTLPPLTTLSPLATASPTPQPDSSSAGAAEPTPVPTTPPPTSQTTTPSPSPMPSTEPTSVSPTPSATSPEPSPSPAPTLSAPSSDLTLTSPLPSAEPSSSVTVVGTSE